MPKKQTAPSDPLAAGADFFDVLEGKESAPAASEAVLTSVPVAVGSSLDDVQEQYRLSLEALIAKLTASTKEIQDRLAELASAADGEKSSIAKIETQMGEHDAKKAACAAKISALEALAADDSADSAAPAKPSKKLAA
jgi:septal ring factor EnvC (AmiA/AmiB activator)